MTTKKRFIQQILFCTLFLCSIFINTNLLAQLPPPEPICGIQGIITSEGEPLPFATVSINATTLGTASDLAGEFTLEQLPEGTFTVRAQALGYKSIEKEITVKKGIVTKLSFDLESDVLGIEQVVVTADRNKKKRTEASVIVTTLSPKLLNTTQSVTLSDGLNYCPGLRMETNCQNCGFTQLRMNGLEGPYSQILINSRSIFSGLAGVYGLELIPANMIDRIEVVRGGGSALYGSNAIAGTVNLITKDPITNSYEVNMQYSSIGVGAEDGDPASDYNINMNTSLVSDDKNTGLAIFGFFRDREPFDANDDDFSEMSKMKNLTLGARLFHRPGYRSKITADFFRINESRRGGNKFEYPNHEADISEALDHEITTGALTYERFVGTGGHWSVYGSTQHVGRDSYYGADQSLSDYGYTEDLTYTIGSQFKSDFGLNTLLVGLETVGGNLTDKKLGHPDFENIVIENNEIVDLPHTENNLVADQKSQTHGAFLQFDRKFGALKASAGLRYDYYKITDNLKEAGDNDGHVVSPRVNLLWNIRPALQWRISYSQGYRAPQIFDEDLHIETSSARKVIHKNSPDLKQETSYSWMSSIDYNRKIGNWNVGLLAEAFYTHLDNPFVNEIGEPDENGTVIYTRVNAENGSTVKGLNLEATLSPYKDLFMKTGFTFQNSEYKDPQDFNEKQYFRTPDKYGFLTIDWDVAPKLCLSSSGTYTGSMLVPYFGPNASNPDEGELRESSDFFDLGLKAEYKVKISNLPFKLYGGVKNIFNSYQDDFDSGAGRDPGYVYGPAAPRTIYFGIKMSNLF
ncbi:TonB-dependent receptor [Marinilabiliaceae bacterium JC017]|nr:TonB-dependent receptor [Marinilabiliaceae bacterium JC017]